MRRCCRCWRDTPVPVPRVHAVDEHLGAILLGRLEGNNDLQGTQSEEEREAVARDLMRVAADLHALEPSTLPIAHLGPPGDPAGHANQQLAHADDVAAQLGDCAEPLFLFALAWLRRNVPSGLHRASLVHSDLGPGNLIHQGGRVSALLDWEVAHWGDAMEDLAAISVRDMATPVGHLPTLYAQYEQAGGDQVDPARVRWYRVLILTRNSMLISIGLGRENPVIDRPQLTMFRILLMRAAAIALCDAIGMARPLEAPMVAGSDSDDLRLISHAWNDQRGVVIPAIDGAHATHRAAGCQRDARLSPSPSTLGGGLPTTRTGCPQRAVRPSPER